MRFQSTRISPGISGQPHIDVEFAELKGGGIYPVTGNRLQAGNFRSTASSCCCPRRPLPRLILHLKRAASARRQSVKLNAGLTESSLSDLAETPR